MSRKVGFRKVQGSRAPRQAEQAKGDVDRVEAEHLEGRNTEEREQTWSEGRTTNLGNYYRENKNG